MANDVEVLLLTGQIDKILDYLLYNTGTLKYETKIKGYDRRHLELDFETRNYHLVTVIHDFNSSYPKHIYDKPDYSNKHVFNALVNMHQDLYAKARGKMLEEVITKALVGIDLQELPDLEIKIDPYSGE